MLQPSHLHHRSPSHARWPTMRGLLACLALASAVRFACSFSLAGCTLGGDPIHLRPSSSANDIQFNRLKLEEDDATTSKSTVILEGLVSKRRAIGKHLVFLDVVPMDLPDIKTHDSKRKDTIYDIESIAPVQAIFRRDLWMNLDDN